MDYSVNFSTRRLSLNEETQGQYREFLKTLSPLYKKVWFDIFFGYAMLFLTLLGVSFFQAHYWFLLSVPVGAVLVGYWVAYLQLFIHEAAHYNIWRDKAGNDLLCDCLISWHLGTSIKEYRAVHFPHHMRLGQVNDTEPSYHNPLTPRFLFEMLTGIHAVRIFLQRRKGKDGTADEEKSLLPLLRGVAIHIVLIVIMLACGAWAAALAWIGGVGVAFPFFATLRQLLEHREPDAPSDADGTPEGVTRLFGDGVFASTFGGAGFNRHLLHHWEPTVSYTRLQEFEAYLRTTSLAPVMDARRMSYARAFLKVLKSDNSRVIHGE